MDVDELEAVVDEMSEESGDQIDTLYDTITLNRDTYNGFICRLREIARLAKCADEETTCSVSDSHKFGNAAAIREALILVQKKINYLIGSLTVPNSLVANRMEINGIINAALASPRLNCEVGTPSEQYQRFKKYCKKKTGGCGKADRYDNPCAYCFSQWAQMTYTEGGAK